jgi:RNA polymerase sigma-70 factor (ECF subfamily)
LDIFLVSFRRLRRNPEERLSPNPIPWHTEGTMDSLPWIPGNSSCPKTDWSLVREAASPNDPVGKAALEKLCLHYWYPIYAFIRRLGEPEEKAQDLTQAFFAHILASEFLAKADPHRGTFKAFLFKACRNFRIDEWKRTRKPFRNNPVVSLDALRDAAERFALEPPAPDPERGFDLDWGYAVLTNALEAVRRRYADRGEAALFDRLRAYLPLHDGEQPGPQAKAAEEGSQTIEAYKKALHDLRAVYSQQVRHEMAQTLSDPAEVEEEIRNLLANVRHLPFAARNGHPAPEARQ